MEITFWPKKKGVAVKASETTKGEKRRAIGRSGVVPQLTTTLVSRAVATFDRASGFIVLTVWGAALAFMALAYIGVQQTIKARNQLVEAEASQPVLPTIAQTPVATSSLQQIADRMKKQLGDKVTVTPAGSQLKITAAKPDNYNYWLSAISYVDSASADTLWTIKDFCVGTECKDALMSVTLNAQTVSFTTPSSESDDGD